MRDNWPGPTEDSEYPFSFSAHAQEKKNTFKLTHPCNKHKASTIGKYLVKEVLEP